MTLRSGKRRSGGRSQMEPPVAEKENGRPETPDHQPETPDQDSEDEAPEEISFSQTRDEFEMAPADLPKKKRRKRADKTESPKAQPEEDTSAPGMLDLSVLEAADSALNSTQEPTIVAKQSGSAVRFLGKRQVFEDEPEVIMKSNIRVVPLAHVTSLERIAKPAGAKASKFLKQSLKHSKQRTTVATAIGPKPTQSKRRR